MDINVLVIDDSAYSRAALRGMLETMPGVNASVETAVDGVDGYRQALKRPPDLIMLDLEMPEMDGYTFLRLIKDSMVPVIVVSGRKADRNAAKAFELGASGYIEKPTRHTSEKLFSIKGEISRRLTTLGIPPISQRAANRRRLKAPNIRFGSPEVVLLGASTGGPRAVSAVVKALPEGLPCACVVAIHMPFWLTKPFAERLNAESLIPVRVATDGGRVEKGTVLVAPGGAHITFHRENGSVFTRLAQATAGDLNTPSIDRAFSSAAEAWGPGLVGAVMTGLGADGSTGAVEIKKRGGTVLAESLESSTVFGMPEAAILTGAVDLVLSCDAVGAWIAERCGMTALKLA